MGLSGECGSSGEEGKGRVVTGSREVRQNSERRLFRTAYYDVNKIQVGELGQIFGRIEWNHHFKNILSTMRLLNHLKAFPFGFASPENGKIISVLTITKYPSEFNEIKKF